MTLYGLLQEVDEEELAAVRDAYFNLSWEEKERFMQEFHALCQLPPQSCGAVWTIEIEELGTWDCQYIYCKDDTTGETDAEFDDCEKFLMGEIRLLGDYQWQPSRAEILTKIIMRIIGKAYAEFPMDFLYTRYWRMNPQDWEIADGVLLRHKGIGTSVTIPISVRAIAADAFRCSPARDVRIPCFVREIREGAFRMSDVRRVWLPYGLQRVEAGTFAGCGDLEFVDVPAAVSYIGPYAFSGCTALQEIRLPERMAMLDEGAFQESGLLGVRISAAIVGKGTFFRCCRLRSVELDENVRIVDRKAFAKCGRLTDVRLAEGIRKLGPHAFRDCRELAELVIPDSVLEIGPLCFRGNDQLHIDFPEALRDHVTRASDCTWYYRDKDFPYDADGKEACFEKSAVRTFRE